MTKAIEQIQTLNRRGRGKKRFETMAALRRAAAVRPDQADVLLGEARAVLDELTARKRAPNSPLARVTAQLQRVLKEQ